MGMSMIFLTQSVIQASKHFLGGGLNTGALLHWFLQRRMPQTELALVEEGWLGAAIYLLHFFLLPHSGRFGIFQVKMVTTIQLYLAN